MTRFSIKIENILGLSYYRYELTSNKYNATIDVADDITITCKVTDIFGNNVNGKAVTLYHDGTSVSTQNTNSNGIATWNITPTTWGLHDFNVSNQHCQVNVKGWRIIGGSLSNSGWQLERNETRARLITTTWSHAVTTSWQQFGSSAYAENVKPKSNVHYSIDTRVVWYIDRTTGKIYFKSATGSNIASTNFAMQWEWSIA